jgi:hypothetical protein
MNMAYIHIKSNWMYAVHVAKLLSTACPDAICHDQGIATSGKVTEQSTGEACYRKKTKKAGDKVSRP